MPWVVLVLKMVEYALISCDFLCQPEDLVEGEVYSAELLLRDKGVN